MAPSTGDMLGTSRAIGYRISDTNTSRLSADQQDSVVVGLLPLGYNMVNERISSNTSSISVAISEVVPQPPAGCRSTSSLINPGRGCGNDAGSRNGSDRSVR